jgi:hypothetical protein
MSAANDAFFGCFFTTFFMGGFFGRCLGTGGLMAVEYVYLRAGYEADFDDSLNFLYFAWICRV